MADNRRVLSRRDVLARAGGLSIAGAMVSTVAPAVEARRLASAPEGGEQTSRSPPRKSPKPSKEPTGGSGICSRPIARSDRNSTEDNTL